MIDCVQREGLSAVRSAVERPGRTSMPVTVLRTVWPKETAVPTTKHSVKVRLILVLRVL